MARTKRKTNPVNPAPAEEKQKQRIYRTGGYARLSVEDSGKPGADTIQNQTDLIQNYIESQADMEFCGLYCDNGQTGTDFARPGFERLMQDVKEGKIDCIVVKDLSRFGRNYREAGNYLERIFPFLGVRFVAVGDNFDTLTAERGGGGYIVPLKNIINEVYSRDISRKSGTALAVKQRRGDFIGTWAAYGYKKRADDRHRIEPDGETAPVVQEIFKLRLSGMSYAKIARTLNGRGISSPSRYHYLKGDAKSERYADVLWQTQTVRKILADRVYLGHMVQGRKRESFYEGKKQEMLPESEWIIVENTHEAIISESDFAAVQEMGKKQKDAYHERLGRYDGLGKTPNIFKGLVYCPDCGRRLVRYKSVTRKGTKVSYFFICPSHAADPASCPKKYLPEGDLSAVLWGTLEKQIELAGDLSGKLESYLCSPESKDAEAALEREAAEAGRALKRAQTLYDSLYPMYAEEKALTEQEYMRMKREYRAQIEKAQAAVEAAEEKKKGRAVQTEENPWLNACMAFQDEKGLTGGMLQALVSRIEVDSGNGIAIKLRYRDDCRRLAETLGVDMDAGSKRMGKVDAGHGGRQEKGASGKGVRP